jgi:alcohol dehydrogenase
MQALVYHGPAEKQWESKPDPAIEQPTDAIVQIDTTTIGGTDLHILKGDFPTVTEGRTLGHEAVGTVVETGSAVEDVRRGDKVLVSCISACGRCRYCRRGLQSQCLSGGGWILGHLVDGTQAQYVRTPFADTSLYGVPTASPMSRCCSWLTYCQRGSRSAC